MAMRINFIEYSFVVVWADSSLFR